MPANLTPSSGYIIVSALSVAFMILYPLVLGLFIHRTLAAPWRWFLYGAGIFFLFQMVTRVPAIQVIQAMIAPKLQGSRPLLWGWLVVLALSAGLFEEVGRYVGYRVLFRQDEKSWRSAVMYGAGHGGIESMLLVGGLALVSLVNLIALMQGGLGQVPAEQRGLAVAQLRAIVAQPIWFPLLGAWERLWTLPSHIAFSVIVVQVFRRGSFLWLWLAVALHTVLDFGAVALLQVLGQSLRTALMQEGCVALFGLLALVAIWILRDRESELPKATPFVEVTPPPAPAA